MITDPDQFFRDLETRRTRALVGRDLPVLEALHASDYQLITPAGKVFTREAYLSAVRDAPFYAGWEILEPLQMRLTADMALLRYQARLTFPSGRIVTCWHTDAYERRGEAWQAVWSQATELKL